MKGTPLLPMSYHTGFFSQNCLEECQSDLKYRIFFMVMVIISISDSQLLHWHWSDYMISPVPVQSPEGYEWATNSLSSHEVLVSQFTSNLQFVQWLVQIINKEYIKAPCYWAFVMWFHLWPVVSPPKQLVMQEMFNLLYPAQRSLGGVYWIHPVRPSVCPSVCLSVRPSVRPWVGVRMITLILFSGFKFFFLHISLGSRSCVGLNISVLPH